MPDGLVAHGRGEAFDYLLGERTIPSATAAIKAAAAHLLLAQDPTISVNGNTAALAAREIAQLAKTIPAKVEVNLFHKSRLRERRIEAHLRRNGVDRVLGTESRRHTTLQGISSNRARVDASGIINADVVLVPLEDGDRAQALRRMGKTLIAIDLNPLSRTARAATVTIVDNIVRALPAIRKYVRLLRRTDRAGLQSLVSDFDNSSSLDQAMAEIRKYLNGWAEND